MKAVQLAHIGKPLQDAEVKLPEPGASDVLVRVAAAGICHSDAHYRAGLSKINRLPVTLGHEVAGRVDKIGTGVTNVAVGDRVCLHYLVHCGSCDFCKQGQEQFCGTVEMIGKHRDGGYAEFINVPARNAFLLPDEISFETGAIMMCSSSTALHALNKARLRPGESVAIFGFGGLGYSALQLTKAFGAGEVYVVEINPTKIAAIAPLGGIPVDAKAGDPVNQIREATAGKGVDISLELIGSGVTMRQAVQCLGTLGRAALAGLTADSLSVLPYTEVINKEAEIIGVSDHLASELPSLIDFVRQGKLRFSGGMVRFVDLDAGQINTTLDALEGSTEQIRTIILTEGNKESG